MTNNRKWSECLILHNNIDKNTFYQVFIFFWDTLYQMGHCNHFDNTPVQFTIYGLLTQGQSRTNNVPCVYNAKDLRDLASSLKSALINFIDLPL